MNRLYFCAFLDLLTEPSSPRTPCTPNVEVIANADGIHPVTKYMGLSRVELKVLIVGSSLLALTFFCIAVAPTVCRHGCALSLGLLAICVVIASALACNGLCIVGNAEQETLCCGCNRKEHDVLSFGGFLCGFLFFFLAILASWTWSGAMLYCMLFFCVTGCIGLGGLQGTHEIAQVH